MYRYWKKHGYMFRCRNHNEPIKTLEYKSWIDNTWKYLAEYITPKQRNTYMRLLIGHYTEKLE